MAKMKNEEQYNALRKDLRIDSLILDEQLCSLAMRCQEAGEFLAEVSADLDYAERKLRDLTVQVNLETREAYVAKDLKFTEGLINNEVQNNPGVVKMSSDLLQLKYEKSLWSNLFDSWRTKTSAMKYYCQMVTAGYVTPNTAYNQSRSDVQKATAAIPRARAKLDD
jgi:hypothetical protein